jgi:tetratricopeptide (TPR) repeat protein
MARLILALAALFATALGAPQASANDPIAEAAMLDRQAEALYQQGRYADAELRYKRTLAIREKAFGPNHPDVATSLSNLAVVYEAEGRPAAAEPLLWRSLVVREQTLGLNHPDVAASLNNLASVYLDEGRPTDAEPLLRRALAIREKALGPNNPDLGPSLNNLASVYQAEGRYADAESLLQRSLAIREKTLGPNHPAVAVGLNNLAVVYESEGRSTDAVPLLQRSLAIREKALGPDHPDVAEGVSNLAVAYRGLGRSADAEALFKRALAMREKVLGPNHPDVATSLGNLALQYQDEGRYADAEPLYQRAVAILVKALGPRTPTVAEIQNNLAALYQDQGRYPEAEPLLQQVLAIQEGALGRDHPSVALTLNNLALLYQEQGHYDRGEQLLRRAQAIQEKASGPDSQAVAKTLSNLASLYRDQGRNGEAEPLFSRVLAIWEKTLGPDHPDLAQSLTNLAGIYLEQGRYAPAEPLLMRALAIEDKALGPDHPLRALTLNSLAAAHLKQGEYDEAERLLQRAVAIEEKAVGPEHPDVVTNGLQNLALVYLARSRYADAEPILKRTVAIQEKALGPDHPSLALSLNNLALLYQAQGQYAEVEPILRRVLAIQEKALGPDHPTVALGLNNLAAFYFTRGQFDQVLSPAGRAVDIMARHLSIAAAQRSGAGLAEQRAARDYFTHYVLFADAVAKSAPDRRPAIEAETFRVAQLAQASSTGIAVAATAARLAAGGGPRGAMIRERQDLVQTWEQLDEALAKAASGAPSDRQAAEQASLRASSEQTSRRLDALDARIAAEFPGYAEFSNPQPVTVDAARTLLADDEALLVFLTTDDDAWLWVVRQSGLGWYHIGIGGKALTTEVTALRARLDPQLNPALAAFPALRAHALYQKLIGPALPMLAGADRLMIVPDGALQSLPITVLVTRPPVQDPERLEDHRAVAWLARDYAVTVLPSVSSLVSLRRYANPDRAPERFLGVGNPVLTGRPVQRNNVVLTDLYRGGSVDIESIRGLPALPETEAELRAIASILGATDNDLLLGARASEPVLRQMPLDRYRIIEFATHGLMAGDLPELGEPALVLSPPPKATPDDDGLLTASKIATLRLNADWVVLSACNTAAGDGTPDAGGLSGLAKAFFYAGSRSLLVSHWPAWSKATVQLTTAAFGEFTRDPSAGRAEALRRAMLAMLDPASPPEFAHPAAWAPFVLAGEGGARR